MRSGISKPLHHARLSLRRSDPPAPFRLGTTFFSPSRHLANVRSDDRLFLGFAFSPPRTPRPQDIGRDCKQSGTEASVKNDGNYQHYAPSGGDNARPPPDERTVKLGKTLRTLQPRLPNILTTPLPQNILSPHISLHLFPSTHPHLPNVSGRVAYHAALWTSPLTWGRLPLVGNVALDILSERMVKDGASWPPGSPSYTPSRSASGNERLIVRWRTCGKSKGTNNGGDARNGGDRQAAGKDKIAGWLGGSNGGLRGREFHGLFIFEFDHEGRIVSHVIERVERGEGWDQPRVAGVVALTDWLLGRFGNKGTEEEVEGLALGLCRVKNPSHPGSRAGELRRAAIERQGSDYNGRRS